MQSIDIEMLIAEINKRIKEDEKKTKSSNNNRATSRIYYEGKLSAFNIVLKLINGLDCEE